jgi:hypothetical protein
VSTDGRKGSTQKLRASLLNHQYLQSLDWHKAICDIKSQDLKLFLCTNDIHIDYEEGTIEWHHPHYLAAKANAEDTPT